VYSLTYISSNIHWPFDRSGATGVTKADLEGKGTLSLVGLLFKALLEMRFTNAEEVRQAFNSSAIPELCHSMLAHDARGEGGNEYKVFREALLCFMCVMQQQGAAELSAEEKVETLRILEAELEKKRQLKFVYHSLRVVLVMMLKLSAGDDTKGHFKEATIDILFAILRAPVPGESGEELGDGTSGSKQGVGNKGKAEDERKGGKGGGGSSSEKEGMKVLGVTSLVVKCKAAELILSLVFNEKNKTLVHAKPANQDILNELLMKDGLGLGLDLVLAKQVSGILRLVFHQQRTTIRTRLRSSSSAAQGEAPLQKLAKLKRTGSLPASHFQKAKIPKHKAISLTRSMSSDAARGRGEQEWRQGSPDQGSPESTYEDSLLSTEDSFLYSDADDDPNAMIPRLPKLMISYSWSQQEAVKQIHTYLTEVGFECWIDIYDMTKAGNSILDAMALAVEDADTVLICMSQEYSDSANCRLEAEHALTQRRPMKFLNMQKDFTRPKGWLGLILGQTLWYDCSTPEKRPKSVDQLADDLLRQTLIPHGQHGSAGVAARLQPLDTVGEPPAAAPLRTEESCDKQMRMSKQHNRDSRSPAEKLFGGGGGGGGVQQPRSSVAAASKQASTTSIRSKDISLSRAETNPLANCAVSRDELVAYLETHDPTKAHTADLVLKIYEGRHFELRRALQEKYSTAIGQGAEATNSTTADAANSARVAAQTQQMQDANVAASASRVSFATSGCVGVGAASNGGSNGTRRLFATKSVVSVVAKQEQEQWEARNREGSNVGAQVGWGASGDSEDGEEGDGEEVPGRAGRAQSCESIPEEAMNAVSMSETDFQDLDSILNQRRSSASDSGSDT
jgi:hypothetical protein